MTQTLEPDAVVVLPRDWAAPRARYGIGALLALLVVTVVWGHWITSHSPRSLVLGALPFFGYWGLSVPSGLGIAIAVAGLLVYGLPKITAEWPWRRALAVVAGASIALSTALTLVDPPTSRWRSISTDYGQFKGFVDAAGGPGGYLRGYVGQQLHLPTHLSAHPPGMPLLLWAADRLGLSGVGFESALALLGAAAAAVAVLVALRELAGADVACRAAPFLVIAPTAIWHTNADSVFAGIALCGVATFVLATGRRGRRADLLAGASGAVFGLSLLFTYGAILLALPMIVVAASRRSWRPLIVTGITTITGIAIPAIWGFSWLAGLQATKSAYDHDLADVRSYWFFLVANLAVTAVATGPAVLVGLTRLRDRGALVLVGAGVATILLADVTGLSSAETERIWQPFVPLVLVAGVAASLGPRWSTRRWLALQAAGTIGLQAFLRSPW